jgi:hypothetical protein
LGGFVGVDEDMDEWLESKIAMWVNIIKQLSMIAETYPQSAYTGMERSVQAEWTFVQQVVRDVGDKFGTVRKVMHRSFLPSLLKGALPDNDPLHRLADLPVKSAGPALTDPVRAELLLPTPSR